MPAKSFDAAYIRVATSLERRRTQASNIMADYLNGALNPWKFRFLSEGLVANTWLDWNAFVKQIIVLSCIGSSTRSGIVIPARAAPDNSEARITYEVTQYAKRHNAVPGKTYTGPLEPTWANPDCIISCLTGLSTNNLLTLQGAFGAAGLIGPKRFHTVRNACAHKTKFMRNEVLGLRSIYLTPHYFDPIDIVWGTNVSTGAIAIFEWIEDLETIADLATS